MLLQLVLLLQHSPRTPPGVKVHQLATQPLLAMHVTERLAVERSPGIGSIFVQSLLEPSEHPLRGKYCSTSVINLSFILASQPFKTTSRIHMGLSRTAVCALKRLCMDSSTAFKSFMLPCALSARRPPERVVGDPLVILGDPGNLNPEKH